MDFNPNAQLTGDVQSAGGGGGRGGGIAIGGIGGVIMLVLALVFGINPGNITGGGADSQPASTSDSSSCKTGADVARDKECRWKAYVTSINNFWGSEMKGYTSVPTITYSGQMQTGCGTASSEVGPFYCPEDKKVYLDTGFADQLLQQLGAKATYSAEAYILGHEYGHHVQDLLGTLSKYQSNQTGETSPSVRIELQADCYAGVWLNSVAKGQDQVLTNVTQSDIDAVSDAAQSVGDDRIQAKTQGQVQPESWTHGSAKMRHHWLAVGFQTGNPNSCDTFSTNNLGQ